MEISQYKKDALRSENPLLAVRGDADLVLQVMNLGVAMGDVIDYLKKVVVYGKPVDYSKVRQLLLDVTDEVSSAMHLANTGEPAEGDTELNMSPRLFHAAVGAYGEAAEKLEYLLGQARGEGLDIDNAVEEAGDSAWYLALEMDELEKLAGITPASVLRKNIRKLEIRFPDKFTLADSEARDYAAEASAMEGVK